MAKRNMMGESQAKLAELEVTATVGGGMVEVTATADKSIKNITIKEEVVDVDDIETLEDLVLAAVNEALRQAEEVSQKEMGKVTGGMPTGGLF
jgi:DNA-binding YbaB/EbfC family protein